jgi:hypothetical protein
VRRFALQESGHRVDGQLTGWWRAKGCSQPGMVATGTIAELAK